jgi:sulfate adenylyltransferase subunit 1 (EFTu-like GTPase family)
VDRGSADKPFRFPVQLVIRPTQDFRGYAGQIVSGTIRVGETVNILPSGRTSRVRRIVTWDGDLDLARAPMSVTLVLDDEIDVSRGDMIAVGEAQVGQRFKADLVWMDERPLDPSRVYLLKHTTRTVSAEVDHGLVLNQIGAVTVSTTRPIMFDRYVDNRGTGSFILIDPATNFTAGAGMIGNAISERTAIGRPSAAERLARLARSASSDEEAIEAMRKALEDLLT